MIGTNGHRADILASPAELVAEVRPGDTVGFGGLMNTCHAMPLIRELIRQGIGDLHVVGLASGLEVDMLIAAGLVRRVSTPTISAETIQPIAPAFRRAAQRGELEVWDCDEGMVYAALQAAAQRVSFAPWPVGMGASYPEVNDGMEVIESPYTGKPVVAIKAIPVDFAFIHTARSDPFGNIQVNGGGFGDRAMARAARRVFATVDRLVGNHEIRRDPNSTAIAGVDAVVHAPYGSHPFASPGHYIHDEAFIREYLEAGNALLRTDDRGPIEAWFDKWVRGPGSHFEYLEAVGIQRVCGLEEGLHYGEAARLPEEALR
jgi:acyl CoA:acetate/3-ketoacid CoA transferase alpha subunit